MKFSTTVLLAILGLLAEVTNGMFFTNSKENDFPRIGKRPGVIKDTSKRQLLDILRAITSERFYKRGPPESAKPEQDWEDLRSFLGGQDQEQDISPYDDDARQPMYERALDETWPALVQRKPSNLPFSI